MISLSTSSKTVTFFPSTTFFTLLPSLSFWATLADDMMKVRNLGRKSLEEVLAKLKELGLSLRENVD